MADLKKKFLSLGLLLLTFCVATAQDTPQFGLNEDNYFEVTAFGQAFHSLAITSAQHSLIPDWFQFPPQTMEAQPAHSPSC